MEQDYPKMKIVLLRIKREILLTRPDEPCEIFYNDFGRYINFIEIEKAFKRLEYDKVIQIIKMPKLYEGDDILSRNNKYIFKILPEFQKYKKQFELDSDDNENPVYEVEYNDSDSTVTLNNFVLCKPRYDSPNDRLIQYLCKNPNRKITTNEIDENCFVDSKRTQELKSMIQNLGFSGNLKRAFFKANKGTIYFRNPVCQKDLDKLGIKKLDFCSKE